MSFKLFVYYSGICGGWAALIGWALGKLLTTAGSVDSNTLRAIIISAGFGAALALSLAAVDGLWNSGGRVGSVIVRGVLGGILGLIVAIPGAWLGQTLADATHQPLLDVVGWILIGLLVGSTIGIYDSMLRLVKGEAAGGAIRKILNGVIGGFIGGVVGGGLRILIKLNTNDNWNSPAVLGIVVLGVAIGLCVGLAQVILKEAWIKVEAGFRPGREMILGKPETTIGRAEACDLGLFGDNQIEKMHAKIMQKGDRYFLLDSNTPGGTFLNDRRISQATPLKSGDQIRVGKSVIRFRERAKR